jgi:hypothetical protein
MSGLNPIEELHDRLSDLELNIIEHLDRNAQFARKQEKRLVELFHIDPTTISREPSFDVVASDKGESNFRELAEKLVKESVIDMRDNINEPINLHVKKRAQQSKNPTSGLLIGERMTEMLSIYAINLITLINSFYLVPNYKETIIKELHQLNVNPITDTGSFNMRICFRYFQLPAYPYIKPIDGQPTYHPYATRIYDLLISSDSVLEPSPSKIFTLQFKTFLEKLITLYEQVEERTSGKGITIAKKYKLRVNTTNKKVKNPKKINKSRKHRKSHKRKQRRPHKRTKRNNKTTKFNYPPQ